MALYSDNAHHQPHGLAPQGGRYANEFEFEILAPLQPVAMHPQGAAAFLNDMIIDPAERVGRCK